MARIGVRVIGYVKRIRDNLLGVPLLYKILVANSLIIVIGAVGGTWLTRLLVAQPNLVLVVLFSFVGITFTLGVNLFLVRAALSPFSAIQSTVREVAQGNARARAQVGSLADPDLRLLASTLNKMLDSTEAHTRTIEAHRQQLRLLSHQVIAAQEEERKRVARELHDETSQSLASLLIDLEMAEESVPEQWGEVRRRLAKAREVATATLQEIRQLIFDLRPTILDDLGLMPAIHWYAKERLERAGVRLRFDTGDFRERLPAQVETTLFRVVQEAINNVAKHAVATSALISLKRDPTHVTVLVADDGQGFDMEEVVPSEERARRLGLFGVGERVALLQGSLTIDSRPGGGTRFLVKIPLAQGEMEHG